MKKLIFTLLILSTSLAHAEHEATYCGKVSTAQDARISGVEEKPDGVLIVKYKSLSGDIWEDNDQTVNGFAAFYLSTNEQKALLEKQKTLSPRLRSDICVEGSWGGSLYDSTSIRNIRLFTDNVYKIFVKR